MRIFTSLLLMPVGLALLMVLIFPGSIGLFAGFVAMVAYFAVVVIRASDWS